MDANADILAETDSFHLMESIGGLLSDTRSFAWNTALPGLSMLIGLRLAQPWICQSLNGGVPCPMFEPENYVMIQPKMFGGQI